MSPNQQFVIAILTLIVPVVTGVVTIVGGWVLFKQQNAKLEAATQASKAAELAANHSKEAAEAMQKNFVAAVTAIAPEVAQKVEVVNPEPVKVAVVEDKD